MSKPPPPLTQDELVDLRSEIHELLNDDDCKLLDRMFAEHAAGKQRIADVGLADPHHFPLYQDMADVEIELANKCNEDSIQAWNRIKERIAQLERLENEESEREA